MRITEIPLGMVSAYLIHTDNKAILVDTGMPGHGNKIMAKIDSIGIKPGEVILIAITHSHQDHIGGIHEVRQLITAPAAVQKEDAPYLQEGKSAPVIPQSGLGRLAVKATGANKAKEIIPPLYPKIVVEEEYDLEQLGFPGKLLHTPGHTAGAMTVYIPELKAACIGDLLMRSLFIFGRAGLPKIAQSQETVIRSLEKLLTLDIETFYASHGGAVPRKDVERLV